MADIAVAWTLSTPWGTINFNNTGVDEFNSFGSDEYYLTEVTGADGAPLRTPIDNRPQTDGGIVHNFFDGPRHLVLEGALVIRSTRVPNSIMIARNTMEANLISALKSIRRDGGTLSWTPRGQGTKSLNVRNEIPVEFSGVEWRVFSFGLVAADPVW